MVADLLDVARIETGTLPVTPEPAEVAVLVDRARSTFISAGGRNNLAIDIPPDLPLVMADSPMLISGAPICPKVGRESSCWTYSERLRSSSSATLITTWS